MPTVSRHAYKAVTFQQLRGFYETARLGSLSAAAASLGLSHPTVWIQVHALEREFGAKLVVPHARGCRLTEAGRLLLRLASPPLTAFGTLKRRFQEARAEITTHVKVATTTRIMLEDLLPCVMAFRQRYPHVRLTLAEMHTIPEVTSAIESGDADLGFCYDLWPLPRNPVLDFEACYEADIFLVTPPHHPLAGRKRITPKDLRRFPLVNSPSGFPDEAIKSSLDKLGIFENPLQCIEASYTTTIRGYVKAGLGVGLVARPASHRSPADLSERSMSRYFGRIPIYSVWRRKASKAEPAGLFVETVRKMLNQPRSKNVVRNAKKEWNRRQKSR